MLRIRQWHLLVLITETIGRQLKQHKQNPLMNILCIFLFFKGANSQQHLYFSTFHAMNYLFYHCLTALAEFIIGNAGLHEWEHKNNFIENKASGT